MRVVHLIPTIILVLRNGLMTNAKAKFSTSTISYPNSYLNYPSNLFRSELPVIIFNKGS